jgi:hypothetical protein
MSEDEKRALTFWVAGEAENKPLSETEMKVL